MNRQNKKDHAQQKEKNSRTVCVVTVFYKGQCFGSLVFDSPETGLSITSALRTMLGPLNEQDISFETALHPLYDTAAIEGELQNAIKSLVPSAPPSPVVDLGKLLTEERALNGLSERIDLSQITGLWRLGDSYRYDSERKAWDEPVSLLRANVRTRFREDGTTEEYEAEFDTGSNPYRYDPERRTLTWERCEHYIVGLSPSRMEVVTHEPITRKHPYEEIHKFVYNRIGT